MAGDAGGGPRAEAFDAWRETRVFIAERGDQSVGAEPKPVQGDFGMIVEAYGDAT